MVTRQTVLPQIPRLTGISVENFKCFGDEQSARIAPLTLVFGKNNTGKSSLLQPLLLLRQSLESTGYEARLNLSGPLNNFGSYHDVIHQHRASDRISLGLKLGLTGRWTADVNMEFCSDEPRPPKLVRLTVGSSDSERVEIRRGVGRGGPYELFVGGHRFGREQELHFSFPAGQFLPVVGGWRIMGGKKPTRAVERAEDRAGTVLRAVRRVLQGLRAVGAFRQRPERRYEFRGGAPGQPDLMGAYAVEAIIEDAISRRRGRVLMQSVNRWLNLVGRVRLQSVRQISKGARIFEVRVRDTDSGRWANFSDVGFGIGQAFPVIVEGLRTRPGDTFLVQEPEIHLHPDAQLAMADFLVDLAISGRTVIAETHSDQILLRVRKRIASSKGPGARLDPRDVSLLYVDKDSSGRSLVRSLPVDELGQVSKWPAGFMEETSRERLQLLRTMADRAGAKRG